MTRQFLGSALVLAAVTSGCTPDYGMTAYAPPGNDAQDVTDTGFLPEETTVPDETTEPSSPLQEPPEDDCDHTSDLIYVIDRAGEALYIFDPVSLQFNFVGDLNCTMWGTPASMAVARDGHVMVRYSDNTVYRVDLQTMACNATSYGAASFGSFGMGYATDTADTWEDQLYVANSDTLAVLDTQTWSLNTVGALPSQSELTGNADGELWAFLPLESPAALVQLDKDTGALVDRMDLPSFPDPTNIDTFGFANWGGEFYLFVREYGMGQTTDVYRVDPASGMSMVVPDSGMDVVGAGVSTCAPTE